MTLSIYPTGIDRVPTFLSPGIVHSVTDEGIRVVLQDNPNELLNCSVLRPIGMQTSTPAVGCPVVVWVDSANRSGVILGALDAPQERQTTVPDELLIEARESLTLRVGDGSITIRADGKILIKGKELVSHAQNVNRVKGGAVAIN
jgi:hypothetical protein